MALVTFPTYIVLITGAGGLGTGVGTGANLGAEAAMFEGCATNP